jgi:hypothetical protein
MRLFAMSVVLLAGCGVDELRTAQKKQADAFEELRFDNEQLAKRLAAAEASLEHIADAERKVAEDNRNSAASVLDAEKHAYRPVPEDLLTGSEIKQLARIRGELAAGRVGRLSEADMRFIYSGPGIGHIDDALFPAVAALMPTEESDPFGNWHTPCRLRDILGLNPKDTLALRMSTDLDGNAVMLSIAARLSEGRELDDDDVSRGRDGYPLLRQKIIEYITARKAAVKKSE